MSVNTGLQIDITAVILFINISTYILHIPKLLLNEIGMIWMQQEIIILRLFVSFMNEIHLNISIDWRVK